MIEVPDDRADQRAEDHVDVDERRIDHALADGVGDVEAEEQERDEVEERRPDDRQCGGSTRVETTVAIEFAASWKPLMKSNASASTTQEHRRG